MTSTQSVDLLKAAFEAFVDKIYILDRQGRYLYVSPRGLQRLGLSAEAIIGRSWQELELAKNVRARFEGDFQAVIASGKPIIRQAAYPGIRNNRYYEYLLSPIQDAADEVQMVVASVRDITLRKEAEERVIKTQQRFRNLCEAAPDGIVLVGKGGIISLVNKQTERIFGYPRTALIGQPIEKLIPQRYHQQHKRHRAAYQQSSTIREMGVGMELYGLRADGTEFPVEVALSPFESEESAETIAIIRDITVRKKTEKQIKHLSHSLQNKLRELATINQELEFFSYSVSHDLRAPLRTMDGFSAILWEEYAEVLDEDGKHYLRRIQTASQRMGLSIDGLLQLSRINRHEIGQSILDLSAMVTGIVADLRQAQPDHPMEVHIQPGMAVQADGKLVLIGLENLLANAWKYTRGQERPQVEFICLEKEGEQVFIVRDNGVGFNQKYEAKLFQVFQRLHGPHEFEGLGIGLATVQRIVRRHGGRIWAEGEEGKGAVFYFTLASNDD